MHTVELDAAATALLGAAAASVRATVEEVVLAALHGAVEALRADNGDPEPRRALVVDVVSSGRPAAGALDRTVGRLEAARPVRLDPREATGLAALKRVKEQRRAAPGDGLGFGVLRHLHAGAAARLAAL